MWRYCSPSRLLARNSHQTTAAGAHLPHFAKAMWGRPESTALGSDKGLDVLYVRLRALALRPGEKCGLERKDHDMRRPNHDLNLGSW